MSFSSKERLAYVGILGRFAVASKNELDDEEMLFLLAMVETLDVDEDAQKKLCHFIDGDAQADTSKQLKQFVERLKGSEVMHALVADLFMLGFIDGELDEQEAELATTFGTALGLPDEHVKLIGEYVAKMMELGDDVPEGTDLLEATGLRVQFESSGIPESTLAMLSTGDTPGREAATAAAERIAAAVQEAEEAEGTSERGLEGTRGADTSRGISGRSFSSFWMRSMKASAKRNALAGLLYKITGTNRPHSWISFFYLITGKRKVGRRPGSMLHAAGTVASILGH
eukprot:TRINITY_DN2790_c0_g1_i1.p2 TRINITY_DN2790_c0_g1~~TRINITY_DN2790_c0_g1_i1.p2  ORF type:complete len:294 (-),score=120.89 TRINITY_DN2790_c0_g1_i1:114-968(-)